MDAVAQEKFSNQILTILLKKIEANTLEIPAMPAAALKCLAVVKDPNFQVKKAVAVLEADPLLSARLLQVASSAAFAGRNTGKLTLEATVMRLGAEKLKGLLVESSARQVMMSKNPKIAQATKGIFEHSLAVALIARDLAALCGRTEDMDVMYMCGLLHDIGKPVVSAVLLEAESTVVGARHQQWVGSDDWVNAVAVTHRTVGVALAEKWGLPEEVRSGIADCLEYDSANRQAPANYVRFANALAKREGIYVGPIDADDVNALIMIGRSLLSVGEELVDKLAHQLKERVTSMN